MIMSAETLLHWMVCISELSQHHRNCMNPICSSSLRPNGTLEIRASKCCLGLKKWGHSFWWRLFREVQGCCCPFIQGSVLFTSHCSDCNSLKPQRSFASLGIVILLQGSWTLSPCFAKNESCKLLYLSLNQILFMFTTFKPMFFLIAFIQRRGRGNINMAWIKSENKLFLIGYRKR